MTRCLPSHVLSLGPTGRGVSFFFFFSISSCQRYLPGSLSKVGHSTLHSWEVVGGGKGFSRTSESFSLLSLNGRR